MLDADERDPPMRPAATARSRLSAKLPLLFFAARRASSEERFLKLPPLTWPPNRPARAWPAESPCHPRPFEFDDAMYSPPVVNIMGPIILCIKKQSYEKPNMDRVANITRNINYQLNFFGNPKGIW